MQKARINSGITQEQAAEALSCGTRTLQRYEAGKQFPPMDMLLIMMEQYKCEIADLFPEQAVSPSPHGEKRQR